MEWSNHRCRCSWANPHNPAYLRYHDEEWGVPVHEDQKLFEFLVLEIFQAGLSWECILQKREAFRQAFDAFDPKKIKDYSEEKIESLKQNCAIVRNERKIRAAVKNAAAFLRIQKEFQTFDRYLWSWTDNQIICETGPTHSALSDRICKDLKKRGMCFLGSTTVYAYLQAVGVINGHEKNCWLFQIAHEAAQEKEN